MFLSSGLVDPELYVVVLGTYRILDPPPESVSVPVKTIILHSNYSGYGAGNDIALLELERPVNFTHRIQPACIPGRSITFPPRMGCWVAGWGSIRQNGKRINQRIPLFFRVSAQSPPESRLKIFKQFLPNLNDFNN